MTGRSLLYVLQRVVPFVIFGLVGWVCLGMQFADGPEVLSDRVLFDLAVADELRQNFVLGPDSDVPLAPTSHVLWQVLVALVGIVVPNLVAAGMLLNAATALAIIWQTIRLAEKLLNHTALVMCAGAIVAVSIPVLGNLLNHGPALLGIALALTALRTHISGVIGDRPVLPLVSAIALGAAMLVHVEFVVLWVGMVLHALLLTQVRRPRYSAGQALLQGLVGAALFALILWPSVHRNVTTSGLAWPFDLDTPQLIAASNGLTDLDATAVNSGGVARAFTETLQAAGTLPAVFLLFSVIGIIILARQFRTRERSRAFLLIGFLLPTVPLLFGLFSLKAGWLAGPAVLGSIYPLLVIVGLYAAFQIGLAINQKAAPIITVLAATAWTVISLLATTGYAVDNREALASTNQSRTAWEDWHESNVRGEGRLRVATDRPGWMCFRNAGKVNLDLTGWSGPHLMNSCRNKDGYIDTDKFSKMLDALEPTARPQAMVLWDKNAETFARRLMTARKGSVITASAKGEIPTILVLQW